MDGVGGIGSKSGVPGDAGEPAPSINRPGSSGQTVRPLNPRLAGAPSRPDGAGPGQPPAKFAAAGGTPAPGSAVEATQATKVRPLASRRQEPMSGIIRRELTDVQNDAAALTERFGDLLNEIEAQFGRMQNPMQRANAMTTLAENLHMLSNIDREQQPATNPRFEIYLRLGNVLAQQSGESARSEQATKSERIAFAQALSAWKNTRGDLKRGERAINSLVELTEADSTTDPAWVKKTVRDILEAAEGQSDILAVLPERLQTVLTVAEFLGSTDIAPAGSWPSFRDETLQRLDDILQRDTQSTTNSDHQRWIGIVRQRVTEIRTEIEQRVRTNDAPSTTDLQ